MATITINIPVDKEQWILDGLALRYYYQDTIPNPLYDDQLPEDPETNPLVIPNPQTKAAFAKEQIIDLIKKGATQGHINAQWEILNSEEDSVILT